MELNLNGKRFAKLGNRERWGEMGSEGTQKVTHTYVTMLQTDGELRLSKKMPGHPSSHQAVLT